MIYKEKKQQLISLLSFTPAAVFAVFAVAVNFITANGKYMFFLGCVCIYNFHTHKKKKTRISSLFKSEIFVWVFKKMLREFYDVSSNESPTKRKIK